MCGKELVKLHTFICLVVLLANLLVSCLFAILLQSCNVSFLLDCEAKTYRDQIPLLTCGGEVSHLLLL